MLQSQTGQIHSEIVVKVNATVDEGIAPLVLAMNDFENVITIDSCQGYGEQPAYVYFKCLGENDSKCKFFCDLAQFLEQNAPAGCEYGLRLEWLTANLDPMAKIWTHPDQVGQLASALSRLAANHRKIRSAYGR